MNDNATVLAIVLMIILCVVFFIGDPDLHDSLLAHANGDCKKTMEIE